MKSFSQMAILFVSIAALLLFVGCDSKSSEDAQQDSAERVTIRLIGEAYAPLEALDELKGQFENEYGINVEIVRKSHSEVVSELSQDLSAKQSSYDLILLPHRLLGRFVEGGQVSPVKPIIESNGLVNMVPPESDFFEPWFHEISWYSGKQYGYPFTNLTMLVVYRADLFEAPKEREAFLERYGYDLAAPSSWEEYRDIAEFFHRPQDGMYGTYINGQQHVALWYEWLNFVYGFGGTILDSQRGDEYGQVALDSPEVVRATEFQMSLLEFSSPEAKNYNWDDALAVMQQGRAAIGLMWTDSIPFLEDSSVSKVSGKIGYGLVPSLDGRGVAQLEGWTYLIPSKSQHSAEAAKFMLWAMNSDVQVAQMLSGGASPRISVYQNDRVSRLPYANAFLQAASVPIPKATFPESGEMTERAVRSLSRVVSGSSATDELHTLAQEYRDLLEDKKGHKPPAPASGP